MQQNISRLQHEMVRLSTVIAEKRGEQQKLEQGNVLMENDFVHALKVGGERSLAAVHVCTVHGGRRQPNVSK